MHASCRQHRHWQFLCRHLDNMLAACDIARAQLHLAMAKSKLSPAAGSMYVSTDVRQRLTSRPPHEPSGSLHSDVAQRLLRNLDTSLKRPAIKRGVQMQPSEKVAHSAGARPPLRASLFVAEAPCQCQSQPLLVLRQSCELIHVLLHGCRQRLQRFRADIPEHLECPAAMHGQSMSA